MRAKSKQSRVRNESEAARPEWSKLLVDAVSEPGVLSNAYSNFWNYSVGNQILASFQCRDRELPLGPIHTFRGWHELGRHVKKGERALTLCMPVSAKRRSDRVDDQSVPGRPIQQEAEPERFTLFVYRRNWFVLAQTEGEEYVPVQLPAWSEANALAALNIDRIPFDHPDGNCQGFAKLRSVAVSPIAFMPHRTLFHELAHVVLGHTAEVAEGTIDGAETIGRSLREVEAECVALICSESLGLPGGEFSRGYIQHWISGEVIPERSAQRVFKAADEIMRAGRPADRVDS